MKGINIIILIALIAFVIAVVSLGWEYYQTLATETSILDLSDKIPSNYLLNH